MKKKSPAENPELLKQIKDQLGLSQNEISDIAQKFTRYDSQRSGYLQKHDVDDVLRDLNLLKDTRTKDYIADEVKGSGLKNFEFIWICQLVVRLKAFLENLDSEDTVTAEYKVVDAFVAMGGNQDGTGYVSKSSIISVIKSEFELNFDIENLLNQIGSTDNLDFQEFCQVFENAGDDGRSMISTLSEKVRGQNQDDASPDFKVRYKDFEKWVRQMDNKKEKSC